jgi:hypothetical protein
VQYSLHRSGKQILLRQGGITRLARGTGRRRRRRLHLRTRLSDHRAHRAIVEMQDDLPGRARSGIA